MVSGVLISSSIATDIRGVCPEYMARVTYTSKVYVNMIFGSRSRHMYIHIHAYTNIHIHVYISIAPSIYIYIHPYIYI